MFISYIPTKPPSQVIKSLQKVIYSEVTTWERRFIVGLVMEMTRRRRLLHHSVKVDTIMFTHDIFHQGHG